MKTVKLLRNKNFKVIRGDIGGSIVDGIINLSRCLDFLFGIATVDAFFIPICKELHLDHERFMTCFGIMYRGSQSKKVILWNT